MAYLITFLEGIITFVSPCLLPLLPVYVAYFAGGISGDSEKQSSTRLRHTLISALGFVLGFTLLFALMGAFTATIGSFFTTNQGILNVLCGVIVIFFGLHFMGIVNIPALQKTLRPTTTHTPHGFFSSLVFGMIFALAWTPCVGAFLGSALALAASSGSTTQGFVLLICYSLGLGIPFVLTAVLIDRLEGTFSWIKQHYRIVNIVSGVLLVLVGILLATGQLGAWLGILSQ